MAGNLEDKHVDSYRCAHGYTLCSHAAVRSTPFGTLGRYAGVGAPPERDAGEVVTVNRLPGALLAIS